MKAPSATGLGEFIRSQRRLAKLSQRDLAKLAGFSDAYLSQIERGLHRPSVRIVRDLAGALNIPADSLLRHMGFLSDDDDSDGKVDGADGSGATEIAIGDDPHLSEEQKRSLLDVYAAFRTANAATAMANAATNPAPAATGQGSGEK